MGLVWRRTPSSSTWLGLGLGLGLGVRVVKCGEMVGFGLASSWECRAAQSRQARPEEAQELSWGAAKAGTLTMLRHPQLLHRLVQARIPC